MTPGLNPRLRLAWACALLGACAPGTGGEPITFALELQSTFHGDANPRTGFITATGWRVVLEEACLAIGPVYFFTGASHLDQAARGAPARPRRFTLVRTAFAHPGHEHFAGGEVRGEWLGQSALDVLTPQPRPLGAQNGLRGDVRAYSLRLDPPRGELTRDPCLRGHPAWLRGTASRDEQDIPFEGGLVIDPIGTNRQVDGLSLRATLRQGSRVTIRVHPAAWLDLAEFDTLPPAGPDGRHPITPDTQVHRAWFIGVRSAAAFSASSLPPG